MTSQAQALAPMPDVRGLAFFGFPLHPASKPSDQRAEHLFNITVPMLFLQGTRDKLADEGLVRSLSRKLGDRASLELLRRVETRANLVRASIIGGCSVTGTDDLGSQLAC